MNGLTSHDLWAWLLPGYLFTIAIETPVLLLLLSRPHRWPRRLAAGVWLTACSYPVVVIAMPALMIGMHPPELMPAGQELLHWRYLAVAETFAPLSECVLFSLAFHTAAVRRSERVQDWIAITLANLSSFLFGEWCWDHHWLDWWQHLWGA